MASPDVDKTSAPSGQVQDAKDDTKNTSTGCMKILKGMANYIGRPFRNTKIIVHILVCIFAIASWVDINGMWAELPILTQDAAESWGLPSYIIVIGQVANIGPVIFVVVSYCAPHTKPRLEKVTSFIIIIISMVASFLLAFFWKETTVVGGTEHSTALLALNFFLSLGDCTSSLSFYAFMSHLKPEYMASLFIGEGLSGMLPGMIALGQGAGEVRCNGTQQLFTEPEFSVKIYFIILSAIIACSAISFLLLNFWSYCKSEMVKQKSEESGKFLPSTQSGKTSYGAVDTQDLVSKENEDSQVKYAAENYGYDGPVSGNSKQENHTNSQENSLVGSKESDVNIVYSNSISRFLEIHDLALWKLFLLLGIIVVINMTLTTFLASIQIYSVLPYGLEYYHLATTLCLIANPVACFITLFVMAERLIVLIILTLLGEAGVVYIIYIAALSPEPPLHEQNEGGELAVAIWILVTGFLVYAKVCVAGVLRKHGRNALIWSGVATQFGALIGAIVGFLLVNHYELFVSAAWCQ